MPALPIDVAGFVFYKIAATDFNLRTVNGAVFLALLRFQVTRTDLNAGIQLVIDELGFEFEFARRLIEPMIGELDCPQKISICSPSPPK